MSTSEAVHAHAQSADMDESIHAHPSANVNSTRIVESSRLLPWLMLACVLSGAAIALSCWAIVEGIGAERKAEIATLRTEGFTRALIAKGIDPYPHLQGEDP